MEMRTAFHKRLREIQDDILAMGSMVSKAILRSIEALKNRDLGLAHQIITDDQKIRVILVLDYEKGDKFKEIVSKVYGSFTPTTIKQAATEAIDKWMKSHS